MIAVWKIWGNVGRQKMSKTSYGVFELKLWIVLTALCKCNGEN